MSYPIYTMCMSCLFVSMNFEMICMNIKGLELSMMLLDIARPHHFHHFWLLMIKVVTNNLQNCMQYL